MSLLCSAQLWCDEVGKMFAYVTVAVRNRVENLTNCDYWCTYCMQDQLWGPLKPLIFLSCNNMILDRLDGSSRDVSWFDIGSRYVAQSCIVNVWYTAVGIPHSVIEDLWASYIWPGNTEENEHPHCFSDLEIFERHSKFVSILTDWHRVCLCHQLWGQMLKYDIHIGRPA